MISRADVQKDLGDGTLSMRAIAEKHGCSLRTVYRIASEPEQRTAYTAADDDKKTLSAMISALDGYYKTEV